MLRLACGDHANQKTCYFASTSHKFCDSVWLCELTGHDSPYCDRLLSNIPGVTSYWGGTPGEFGRSNVDSDYDVALCIGFNTDQAYAEYLVDPAHLELVSRWKPQFEWIRIHDVLSATP